MTRGDIDRRISDAIRLEIVAQGLLPNQWNYTTIEDYILAKNTLRDTLSDGQLVEVLGVGSAFDKGEQTACNIIIHRGSESNGDVGGNADEFESYQIGGETKFRKFVYPHSTKDINYTIRLIATSPNKERILHEIVSNALGGFSYLEGLGTDRLGTTEFFNLYRQASIFIGNEDEIIEYLYTYKVKDVWVENTKTIRDNISPIKEVRISINDEVEKTVSF